MIDWGVETSRLNEAIPQAIEPLANYTPIRLTHINTWNLMIHLFNKSTPTMTMIIQSCCYLPSLKLSTLTFFNYARDFM